MEPGEYETIAQLEERHWWYRGMQAMARRVAAALPLPRDAKILDAGCGAGGNLAWLAECGQVTGIDSSPLAIEYAVQKAAGRLAMGSVSALPFSSDRFHLITSFEVLYHQSVPDDAAALREFQRVLKPGGWLILRLPAHNWLRGSHDLQVHTARRYGNRELRRKLRVAGFEVDHMTPVGLWLLPGAIVSRGLEALGHNHHRPASDVRMPPESINRLLMNALVLEGWVAARRRLPWGLSQFAVAHKRLTTTEYTERYAHR